MSIRDTINEIIEEFASFDDWMDKYNYLIEMGKSLPESTIKYKIDSNLITGCQSRVWLHLDYEDGIIRFTADSDAVITKGIVNLLIRVFSEHTRTKSWPQKPNFWMKSDLKEHLSPTRSNGLLSMIKQIKLYALAYKATVKYSTQRLITHF
jgi:cysteine desulfuration protein SufE